MKTLFNPVFWILRSILYGIGPDTPSKQKMVSHKIVDGLQGVQSGPVPMSSERKETDKMNMRLVLAGRDPVAVDTVCCLVMGWDPESVGYLNLFRERDGLGKITDVRIRGVYADEVRKHFTIFRENLGGTPVEEEEGPVLSAEVRTNGNQIVIRYQTDEKARKIEVLVDGMFQCLKKAEEKGEIHLIVPDFSKGNHSIQVTAYDRFLNKTLLSRPDVCAGTTAVLTPGRSED